MIVSERLGDLPGARSGEVSAVGPGFARRRRRAARSARSCCAIASPPRGPPRSASIALRAAGQLARLGVVVLAGHPLGPDQRGPRPRRIRSRSAAYHRLPHQAPRRPGTRSRSRRPWSGRRRSARACSSSVSSTAIEVSHRTSARRRHGADRDPRRRLRRIRRRAAWPRRRRRPSRRVLGVPRPCPGQHLEDRQRAQVAGPLGDLGRFARQRVDLGAVHAEAPGEVELEQARVHGERVRLLRSPRAPRPESPPARAASPPGAGC